MSIGISTPNLQTPSYERHGKDQNDKVDGNIRRRHSNNERKNDDALSLQIAYRLDSGGNMSATSRKIGNEKCDGPCCDYTYEYPIENTETSSSENAPI